MPKLFRAAYSYDAVNDDELSLAEGDVVTLVRDDGDPGWCFGRTKMGEMVPRNYLEEMPVTPPPVPRTSPVASPSQAPNSPLQQELSYYKGPAHQAIPVHVHHLHNGGGSQRRNIVKNDATSYQTSIVQSKNDRLQKPRYTNMRGVKMKQTRYMTWGHNIATVSAIALFMGGPHACVVEEPGAHGDTNTHRWVRTTPRQPTRVERGVRWYRSWYCIWRWSHYIFV